MSPVGAGSDFGRLWLDTVRDSYCSREDSYTCYKMKERGHRECLHVGS